MSIAERNTDATDAMRVISVARASASVCAREWDYSLGAEKEKS